MKLRELEDHLHEVYGNRNDEYLQDLLVRAVFLTLVVGDLQDVVRKFPTDRNRITLAVSRIIPWAMCVAAGAQINCNRAMVFKYPSGGCIYCGNLVCTECTATNRRTYTHQVEAVETQYDWTIAEWQSHFGLTYGEKNRTSGLEYCILRLFKEAAEVQMAILADKQQGRRGANSTSFVNDEVPDVIAWAFAIAVLLDIDLQRVIVGQYGENCKVCRNSPCTCGEFQVDSRGHLLVGSTTLSGPISSS